MSSSNMGKMLFVDLSTGEMKEEVPDESLYRDYLGGYGVGARILYTRLKPGIDPLGPENIFGIIAGPLTASGMPFGGRYTVVCKSPLTGGWGDANSGGDFGAYLKFSGYDAIFLEGISPTPVYLLVQDGKAELKDASGLWGKDSFVTEDELGSIYGKKIGVACIGQAGEKLSRISSLMNNKGRAAGRSGVGAVFGSKKLKAVVVMGNQKVETADPALLAECRKAHMASFPPGDLERRRKYGTSAGGYGNAHTGGSPVKNWAGVGVVDFPDIEPLHGDNVNKNKIRPYACYHCPAACGAHMAAGTGEYEYEEGAHRPEYETWASFGTMCLNNNVESIIKCNDICNRDGMDTISVGATVAFAIECYENGLISKEDTGGLELTWGNHRSIVALTEMIGKREGIGNILADGTRLAAERIGKGAEQYAVHAGGQEPGMHDPKLRTGLAIAYQVDATPARHMQGSSSSLEGGARMIGIDVEPVDKFNWAGKGEAHKAGSAWRHIVNCAGLCAFGVGNGLDANVIADAMTAATGIKYTVNDLLKAGDRIASLRTAFNIREGINPGEVYVNPRMISIPKEAGPTKGVVVDQETQVQAYFKSIGWDEKGKPTKDTLMALGLDDVAEDLYKD